MCAEVGVGGGCEMRGWVISREKGAEVSEFQSEVKKDYKTSLKKLATS